jgi:hypothetical protein
MKPSSLNGIVFIQLRTVICLQNIEAMRALHRMTSIGDAVGSAPSPHRRGTSLFQFYRNAAVLNLDLCFWMASFNDFTLPGGLVIGLRFFDEALVLPNDVSFTPSWNHFTTQGL